MTDLFAASSSAMVGDFVAEPWSSLARNLSLKGSLPNCDLPEFAWLTAYWTENSMSRPSCKFPPESGPS